MKITGLYFLLVALIVGIAIWVSSVPSPCVEGDACWNCHTMGNHICGTP